MIGVAVLIVNNKKQLLVSKRLDPDKNGYGCYALAGGKLEDDETVFQCAIRESKEETGLDIEPKGIFHTWMDSGGNCTSIFVNAKALTYTVKNTEPDKHSPWLWYSLDTLKTFIKKSKDWIPIDVLEQQREDLGL
jgi:8-oxo-dGTP diphosphatase